MSQDSDIQMKEPSPENTQVASTAPTVIDPSSQVQIRLVTRDTKYSVPDVPLYVPVSLRRYGLSEVVNKLLEQGHDDRVAEGLEALLPGETEDGGFTHIPFDFLADDGSLLRTASLAEYLSKRGLSAENALTLEYTRAVLPPSYLASYSHPDWVSAVDIFKHSKAGGVVGEDGARVCDASPIATGSYDGVIRLWTPSATVSHQLVAHNAAIKSIKWTSPSTLVSASNDRMLCLWSLKPSQDTGDITANSSISALLRGHTDAINDVAISSPNTSTNNNPLSILSASADKTLKLWSTDYKQLPQFEEDESISAASKKNTASQKRRKLAMHKLPQARSRTALLTLTGHTQPVTGTIFHPNSAVHGASVAYSVGLDHTIKTWDLQTGTQVSSKTSGFSLTCMTALADLGLLACGSSARHILLHDPRDGSSSSSDGQLSLLSSDNNSSVSKATLVGHTNMVTSLAPSPHSQYVFVSGALDGTARVWDIRAQHSLYVIEREKGAGKIKTVGGLNAVLDVDWSKDVGIVSAGKDNMLQINSSGETHA